MYQRTIFAANIPYVRWDETRYDNEQLILFNMFIFLIRR